eukprot:556486_1
MSGGTFVNLTAVIVILIFVILFCVYCRGRNSHIDEKMAEAEAMQQIMNNKNKNKNNIEKDENESESEPELQMKEEIDMKDPNDENNKAENKDEKNENNLNIIVDEKEEFSSDSEEYSMSKMIEEY